MDPVTFVVGRFKEFGRSTERFVKGVLQSCHKRASQGPIETLKRLQREAFSDLMKLRERQDKVERMLSFYQSGKGGPFQEARTQMKGIINADGALMFIENDYQQGSDNLDRLGTRRGIDLRFIFETSIRQRDLLIAEFFASHCSPVNHSNVNGCPLALSKLVYLANICDSLSAVFAPFGAQCTEFGTSFQQGRYESASPSFSPPLFQQSEGCGLGFIVKGPNLSASLAGLVSGLVEEASFVGNIRQTIFGQVSCKPSEEARLTMSGIWQTSKSSQLLKLGPMALPRGSLNKRSKVNASLQGSSSATPSTVEFLASSSIALMLESQFNETNNLDCWVEMWKSNPGLLKWGISLYDAPPDELGWGFKLGGQIEGHFNQFWLEGFLNFSLGKKAVLQPGILYTVNGESRTPAILLRSSWFM
ncbi:hypothetical protein IEQ34_006319 [Dendrobium chrysotoxum]|uniref:Uncharacterized protein n=1 Tax=Dendrobium chrysotoxum TaxID=161865 RepID=A0AAV7HB06_DENCH|nr:hypothetical protein IEQ34_006319 [Dendrobium chrysotoxum]